MKLPVILIALVATSYAQTPKVHVEWLQSSARITNTSSSPMTAFFVGVMKASPGRTEWTSEFQDMFSNVASKPVLQPGDQKDVPLQVNALPEDRRVVAALFADGTSEGDQEAVDFLVELRKSTAAAIPSLIEKLQSLAAGGATKQDIVAALRKTADNRHGVKSGSGLADPVPFGEITAFTGAAKLLAERPDTYDVYSVIPVLQDWQHRLEQSIPAK